MPTIPIRVIRIKWLIITSAMLFPPKTKPTKKKTNCICLPEESAHYNLPDKFDCRAKCLIQIK